MKNKKLTRLRYNLWLYFIVFTLIIIIIVWIFQILLFESIYQQKKYNSLIENGDELRELLNVEGEINDDVIESWLTKAVDANEAGIFSYLAYFNGSELKVESIYSGFVNLKNESPENGTISDISSVESNSSKQPSSNGTTFPSVSNRSVDEQSLVKEAIKRLDKAIAENDQTNNIIIYKHSAENEESYYIYATKVSNENLPSGYLVLRTSQQTLVETVSIIQSQLIIVTVFVIIIAFFISWYISDRVSRPIVDMSNTAKKWANGDEFVSFESNSYQELSELADTLNYAKDAISQTGVLQRDLLANVSHDLKTPLTMIKAYAEMIRDLSGDIKEKRDLHTQVIIDESDRLAMLVNDILDLSKLQNGMTQLNIERVNLSELCEKVVYRFNDFVEQSGYKIEKEIEADLFVDCDVAKIEQVFYNLIGNSINYTGQDKIILVKLSRNGSSILFESIDSGKGISQENIYTIWEKYYRFSETHQRPIKGTGLGLSIVKTILEQHRLKFGVISKKDVGSNFFVQFKESEIE